MHVHLFRLIFSILLLFSILPNAVMAGSLPSYTPVTAESLQQTNKQLLTTNVLSLTQSVAKLTHAQATLLTTVSLVQHHLIAIQAESEEVMFNLAIGLLLLFFLFLCLFEEEVEPNKVSFSAAETHTPPKLSEENDIRDEFDFMATDQAIPAKLDLARAYKDMGDIPAARATLEEVLKNGNASQIIEARQLLATFNL